MPLLSVHEDYPFVSYYLYNKTVFLVFNNNLNIVEKIQDAICCEVNSMIDKYSRVKAILFNMHIKKYSKDNAVISKFMRSYINKLERKYNTHIGYIWVREQEKSDKQHYHIAIFINAKVCKCAWNIINIAKDSCQNIQKIGTIHYVKNGLYTMFRKNHVSIQTVILRLSYYAKRYSKTLREPKTKRFQIRHHK
ncbi:YagK/YfjJ domain-containing protein [Photobacterium leiognathi]|uniref:YagK/YfjJ domain-containing protein n=1 Tax=Photobacterium leiognathi TaxID=553611 RepID=UPI0029828957|nr:inovirus-type Gp2 protein [Photobacterium leiognathi]